MTMTSPDQTPPGPAEEPTPAVSGAAPTPPLDGSELPEGYNRPSASEAPTDSADYAWDGAGSDDTTTTLPAFGSEAPTHEMPPAPPAYTGSPAPWSGASADAPPAPGAYPPASADQVPDGYPGSPAAFSPAAGAQQSAAPAPAPSVDLAALGAKATSLGISNPLPALAVAGATWVGGLLVSALLLVLIAIVGATGSGQETVSSATGGASQDLSGIGVLFALPFQLLALAGLGSLGGHAQIPLIGDASASIRFIPLLAALALALLPFLGARLVVRRRGAARALGIAVEALLAGFVTALLVTLGALIIAVSIPLEDGLSIRLHAAGPDSFFGTWLIVGVAYALGQITAGRGPARGGRFTDVLAGARLALLHAAAFSAVAFLGVWITAIVQAIRNGDGIAGAIIGTPVALLVALGQFVAGACGLGMLGSVGASGGLGSFGLGGTGMGATQYASIFSAPWWVWLLTLLLGLVLLALTAAVWGSGRTIIPGDATAMVVSWAALPLVYFLGTILLAIIGHVGGSLSVPDQGSLGFSLGLAPWVPFLALLVGAAVEGLSRLLSPLVGGMVPAFAERLVRGRHGQASPVSGAPDVLSPTGAAPWAAGAAPAAAPAAAGSAAQAGSGAAQAGSTASAPVVAPVPLGGTSQRAPMTKEAKQRLLLILGLLGAAVALVVAAIVAIVVMRSTIFSPKHEVESYLDALTAGDYSAASQIAPPNAPNANRVLLTDAVGAKTEKRITSYTIDDVTVAEDSATVTATLDQDGERTQQTFTVDRAGSRFLVFPEWKLGEIDYSTLSFYLPQGVQKVTVNGVEVEVGKLETSPDEMGYEVASLPVLPGTYEFTGPALGEYVEAEPVSTTVAADGAVADSSGGYVYLNYIINDAGQKKVQEDVNAKIDECAATGQPEPSGCPLDAYAYNDTAGTWSVTSYPVVTLEQGDEGAFYLQTETDGAATFSYTYDSFGTPTPMTQEDTITVNGTVTFDEKGALTIEYSDY